jgi:hypothetical protein
VSVGRMTGTEVHGVDAVRGEVCDGRPGLLGLDRTGSRVSIRTSAESVTTRAGLALLVISSVAPAGVSEWRYDSASSGVRSGGYRRLSVAIASPGMTLSAIPDSSRVTATTSLNSSRRDGAQARARSRKPRPPARSRYQRATAGPVTAPPPNESRDVAEAAGLNPSIGRLKNDRQRRVESARAREERKRVVLARSSSSRERARRRTTRVSVSRSRTARGDCVRPSCHRAEPVTAPSDLTGQVVLRGHRSCARPGDTVRRRSAGRRANASSPRSRAREVDEPRCARSSSLAD